MSEIPTEMRKKNSAAPPLSLLRRHGEDEAMCLCGVESLGLEEEEKPLSCDLMGDEFLSRYKIPTGTKRNTFYPG